MQCCSVTLVWFLSPRSTLLPLAGFLLVLTSSCAGSSVGNSVQKSLEADPQLQEQYRFGDQAAETETTPEASPSPIAGGDTATRPQPGDAAFIGPLPLAQGEPSQPAPSGMTAATQASALLSEVPADLKPYVQDWLALGLLEKEAAAVGIDSASSSFQPNQPLTRATFAQWLLTANNQFYADQPAKRIRPGTPNSTPAFQDVPPSHPNYSAIQGLAEAGIIPSALSGNSTAVTFHPNDPLTRQTLVLWKVPLDTRTPLPAATVEAVQATWGFQDAAQVEPIALRAVLADRQTGDFSNILRAFGYTTLFQPKKAVSQAEAAAALWRFGTQTEGVSAKDVLQRLDSAPPKSSQP